MARTKSVTGRSRTTSAARAVSVTNGAANTKPKNSKGKNGGRQVTQPLKQPSERPKRPSKKAAEAAAAAAAAAAAVAAAVTTRAGPAHSTVVAPTSPSTLVTTDSELAPSLAEASPTPSASSSVGPARTLRPRAPRAQPYSKKPAKPRRQPTRAATPAPFAQDDDTSDDDSTGPITPTTTPTRPAVRGLDHVSPLLAGRTPIGKSPLRQCLMTAQDLEELQSPGPAVDSAAPTNFHTLLVAPVLLSVTWGASFSTVDDGVLAAATALVHLRESEHA